MPRPRFEKLPIEKRELILEVAAQAFAAHGFEGASLNQILEQAGVSKGAAYYYFDDKLDLFVTAVSYYAGSLAGDVADGLSQMTAENYWDMLTAMYQQQFAYNRERPWAMKLVKSVGQLSGGGTAVPELAGFVQQITQWLSGLLHHGQLLGTVRTDLPDDLLFAVFAAVDNANDEWLMAHGAELDERMFETAVIRAVGLLKQISQPSKGHND